ncbi:MAG: orotidine-5'-phosphate decarboxylase [Phycisphaerales bacterium]
MSAPNASHMLEAAWRERRSVLSVGLEPCAEYLPGAGAGAGAGGSPFAPTIVGYERWLMAVAEAAAPFASAYKFNLAFFEALGPEGWSLLKRVRDRLPRGVMVIADAKRGDIGSTAKRYAQATFEWLNADAVTLNPLMGRDSAEPFLAYAGKLCYFLCLTSNPGSKDFLQSGDLFLDIARGVSTWGDPERCGLVVGATHPEQVARVREAAPRAPMLIPGVGAQGGEIESVAAAGRCLGTSALKADRIEESARRADAPAGPGLLFHVTRGVLPGAEESASEPAFRAAVASKCAAYRDRMAAALGVGASADIARVEKVSPAHA